MWRSPAAAWIPEAVRYAARAGCRSPVGPHVRRSWTHRKRCAPATPPFTGRTESAPAGPVAESRRLKEDCDKLVRPSPRQVEETCAAAVMDLAKLGSAPGRLKTESATELALPRRDDDVCCCARTPWPRVTG
jgi:hypothetical protein